MPSDHEAIKMADATLAAHHEIMKSGTPEMQTLSRLLLYLVGQQVAKIEAPNSAFIRRDTADGS